MSPPTVVLLVEDNEMNQDMLRRRFEKLSHVVFTASNGKDGIRLALKEQPDIIFMDMSMPVMDGWDATKRLKADLRTKHIPVIGISAHAEREDLIKAHAAGCNSYVTKPIKFASLRAKMEALLTQSLVCDSGLAV